MSLPLAQLADLFSERGCNVIIVIGFLVPVIGWLISVALYGMKRLRTICVVTFYFLGLPQAGLYFFAGTENPLTMVTPLLLSPVGVVLGLVILIPFEQIARKPE